MTQKRHVHRQRPRARDRQPVARSPACSSRPPTTALTSWARSSVSRLVVEFDTTEDLLYVRIGPQAQFLGTSSCRALGLREAKIFCARSTRLIVSHPRIRSCCGRSIPRATRRRTCWHELAHSIKSKSVRSCALRPQDQRRHLKGNQKAKVTEIEVDTTDLERVVG